MALKQERHFFKGMLRDLAVSRFNPEFVFDALNIRITARDNNTLLSVTNERGNKELLITPDPEGKPINEISVEYRVTEDLIHEALFRFSSNPPVPFTLSFNFTLITGYTYTVDIEYPVMPSYPIVYRLGTEGVINSAWAEDSEDKYTYIFNGTIAIAGTLIGYCTLGSYWVAFTQDESYSRIYRIKFTPEGEAVGTLLYQGHLNFNTNYPIEALGVYENDNIQKVYWVDGLNQPRVINIVALNSVRQKWDDGSFNFVQDLKLGENITVTRNDLANGMFSSGVILYAFSYYNKYGLESNIFYTTPLLYISFSDRGASPEDKVSNSFTITINNPDKRFDYLRIYSIHRASLDATPNVLNVADLSINADTQELTYVDNGTTGVSVDPAELLYIGGEEVVFSTMTQKDNTLFLGNANIKRKLIDTQVINSIKNGRVVFLAKRMTSGAAPTGFYPYKNPLSKGSQIKTFKYLEWYRFGVQFQHKSGKWSEPVWVNDVYNTTKPSSIQVNDFPYLVKALYTLKKEIIDLLVPEGFIKARGIVVYPTLTDREVVAQGILCPTVFNVGDRHGNSPFAQASWFVRPNQPYDFEKARDFRQSPEGGYMHDWRDRNNTLSYSGNSKYGLWNNDLTKLEIKDSSGTVTQTINIDPINKGAWMEFRHRHPIPGNDKKNAEIQCLTNVPIDDLTGVGDQAGLNQWVSHRQEYFFVDQSIVTLHSPDIEFDTNILSLDSSNLKLRIVGMVPLTSFAGDINVQTSTPQANLKMQGFYKEPFGSDNISRFGFRGLVSGAFWFDDLSRYKDNTGNPQNLTTGFVVYPWHRNGSLNNFGTPDTNTPTRPAMLDKKKMSNLRYAYTSIYFSADSIWNAYVEGDNKKTGISGVGIFNSDELSLVRLPAPLYSKLGDINYYGNIDKVINITRVDTRGDGYPIMTTGILKADQNPHLLFSGNYISLVNSNYTNDLYGTEPVSMKYKSTPHAVMALNFSVSGNYQRVLPTLQDCEGYPATCWAINSVDTGSTLNTPFWYYPNNCGISLDVLISPVNGGSFEETLSYGWLWIGELYNDQVTNRFGGQTEEAFENNLWLPAGEPVSIIDGYDQASNPVPAIEEVSIEYTEGDTFLGRYDCLKTYPYTDSDQNSVVDIVSFLCETRVNIEGRYDRNRGLINNLIMTPLNFNKINTSYSQRNNFFNYRGLNHDKFNLNYFPSAVTWTKEKQLGSDIDTWTNITMASTLDLDGDKGEVVSLNTYNNEIFCFLRQGLSNILFNSRVQIPTSDGLPIEITNGLKVSGKRYISNSIGCSNKWSIAESPSGLYFIDNETNSLYLFNGEISSLSDNLGFRLWISDYNTHNNWDPVNYNNYRTFYDKNNNDVYFTFKDHCLCYSELLNQFTSFMSYESVPAMFNVKSEFFAFKDGKLWEQFAGDYNMFFGKYKPFSITFVSNAEEASDKIFNTIEFRSDSWDNGTLISNKTFDTLDVWNEYQRGTTSLYNIIGHPSPLKRKFRIWRANIPRDSANNRDRIRNTWAYIKLSMNTPNTYMTEFYDATVHYFS